MYQREASSYALNETRHLSWVRRVAHVEQGQLDPQINGPAPRIFSRFFPQPQEKRVRNWVQIVRVARDFQLALDERSRGI
jgi:hypothetical protein